MQGLLWDQQFHETINLNTDSEISASKQYSNEMQSEYYQLLYKSVTDQGCPAAQWIQSLYRVYLQTLLLRNRLEEDGGITTADI